MSSCHHPVILEFGLSSFGTLPRQHTHAGRMRFLSTVATLIPFHPRSPCRSHTPSSWHLAPARPHPLLGGGRRLLSSRRKADASGGEGEGEGAPAAAVPRAAVAIVARCEPPGGRTARYGLVQRANPPNRGMWSLPGGKIEAGEGTLSAARRELREETGLGEDADAATGGRGTKGALRGVRWAGGAPFTSSDSIHLGPDGGVRWHYVISQCFAEIGPVGAEPPTMTASDDAADARWWTMAEIRDGVGEGTVSAGVERVVDRAEAMRSAGLLEIG